MFKASQVRPQERYLIKWQDNIYANFRQRVTTLKMIKHDKVLIYSEFLVTTIPSGLKLQHLGERIHTAIHSGK